MARSPLHKPTMGSAGGCPFPAYAHPSAQEGPLTAHALLVPWPGPRHMVGGGADGGPAAHPALLRPV